MYHVFWVNKLTITVSQKIINIGLLVILYKYWLMRHTLNMPILKTIQTKDYFLLLHCAVRSHLSPSKGVPVLFLSFLYSSNENNYFFFVMLLYTLITMCKTKIARRIVNMWRPGSVWYINNILSSFSWIGLTYFYLIQNWGDMVS